MKRYPLRQLSTRSVLMAAVVMLTVACRSNETAPQATATPASSATQPFMATTPLPTAALIERAAPQDLVPDPVSGNLPNGSTMHVADVETGDVLTVNVPGAEFTAFRGGLADSSMLVSAGSVVYVLDLEGGGTLTTLLEITIFDQLFVSPTGRFVADLTGEPDPTLVVISVADRREILRTPVQRYSGHLMWAPDEEHLVYSAAHPNDETRGAAFVAPLTEPATTTMLDDLIEEPSVAWTPDSRSLVFTTSEGIVRRDIETGERSVLYALPPEFASPIRLSLSPDGQYALVVGPTDIVLPLTGGEGIEITSALGAQWSPVEDLLLVTANSCLPTEREIWLIEPDGTVRATLGSESHPNLARWSSDGTRIAYETIFVAPEKRSTTVVSVEDGQERVLREMPHVWDTMWWSPDGRWIVFVPHGWGICESGPYEMTEIRPFP